MAEAAALRADREIAPIPTAARVPRTVASAAARAPLELSPPSPPSLYPSTLSHGQTRAGLGGEGGYGAVLAFPDSAG